MGRPKSGSAASGDRSTAIPGLTGLRAVMGTWVVADHLREPIFELLPVLRPLQPLLSGGIALDTFFILSGFVISHVYATRLSTLDRRAYGTFLWARVTRLWPVHVFALTISVVLIVVFVAGGSTLATYDVSIGTLLGNLAMLQSIPGVTPLNGPSWAVSVEMGAYVLFPVVAVCVTRARRLTALTLAVLVVVAEMVVLPILAASGPTLLVISLVWVRPVGEFVMGCALWAAWRHGIRRHWGWDIVVLAALGAVAVIMYLSPSDLTMATMYTAPSSAARIFAVALLGVVVVAATRTVGPVKRLLEARPILWAGRTSYSRYLLHLPVLAVVNLVVPFDAAASSPAAVRVAVVLSWFVAVYVAGGLTHRFVEEPARRWMRSLGRRERHAGEATPATASSTPAVGRSTPTTPIEPRTG